MPRSRGRPEPPPKPPARGDRVFYLYPDEVGGVTINNKRGGHWFAGTVTKLKKRKNTVTHICMLFDDGAQSEALPLAQSKEHGPVWRHAAAKAKPKSKARKKPAAKKKKKPAKC